MKNIFLLFAALLLASLLSVQAQSCNDGIKNGDELKTDCGGADCVPCLNIAYAGVCDADNGVFSLNLYFENDPNGIYYIQGDINFEDYNPGIDPNPLLIQYEDGSGINITVKKYNEDGDVIGTAVIRDGFLACTKLSELYECPASSDLEVEYEMTECNADAGTFYLHLDISGGVAPFQITNDTLENLYYDADFAENSINIGPLQDGELILFSLIDSQGCVEDLFLNYDFSTCQITGTISGFATVAPPTLSVIPDPSRRRFEIQSSGSDNNWYYHLYSISGEMIQEGKMVIGNGSYPGYIPYPTKAAGIHFLTLDNGKQKFSAKYLLNNH